MIRDGSRYPEKLMEGSRAVDAIFDGSRPVWMSPGTQRDVTKIWLDANVTTICHTTRETDAHWMDVEVILPADFTGNPADGWTGPMVAGKPDIHLGLHWSSNLISWTAACSGWTAAPGTWPETVGTTQKRWMARYEIPVWWEDVMVDMASSSDRYGKSITDIQLFGSSLALDYPYSPTQIADGTLEADLQGLGITGATVTVVTGSLIATARWHTQSGSKMLTVTMSGTNVTDVKYQGTTVSASYPYSMPSQQAALQSALTASLGGDPNNKAVVMLHKDTWTIELPDLVTTGNVRNMVIFIDPGDPFPAWNMYGEYQGMAPAAIILGEPSNVRTPTGDPLLEAQKGFARIGLILP